MKPQTNSLYTTDQIRQLEQLAIERYQIPEQQLMERAGQAAFEALTGRWPNAQALAVFCGKGNNGGDGFVVARLALEKSMRVSLQLLCEIEQLPAAAKNAAQQFVAAGGRITPFTVNESIDADVIVDALLGIGISGEVRGSYGDAIANMNHAKLPIMAIDIPSGIAADTGVVCGNAVKANLTITFIGVKRGCFTASAPAYCGELRLDTLGLPSEAFTSITPSATRLEKSVVTTLLPPRPKDAHKGTFGHVLVIGGACGMSGAVRMAAEAAARVGAGLVSVATRPEHANTFTAARPELMVHAVTKPSELEPLLAKADVIVIGPGLGHQSWGRELWQHIAQHPLPKVVDADGLNLLAESPVKQNNWLLTPHPGEAGRLLATTTEHIQADRFAATLQIQTQYSGVVVLKGAGTLIYDGSTLNLCPFGNPGMASGGMGDVLSGVLGGLVAQGLSLSQAAQAGVVIHALAADTAAKQGERGLLAMDVVQQLRATVNGLRQ